MKRRKKQKPLYYTQFFWKIHEVFTLSGCRSATSSPGVGARQNPASPFGGKLPVAN